MKQETDNSMVASRIEHRERSMIVGINRSYTATTNAEIPAQWQSFARLIGRLSNSPNPVTYGVIHKATNTSIGYLTGVESASEDTVIDGLTHLHLDQHTYAVFNHSGHVAALKQTCDAIWSEGLSNSGRTPVQGPWFERYGESFNPLTGEGGAEIWIPVET